MSSIRPTSGMSFLCSTTLRNLSSLERVGRSTTIRAIVSDRGRCRDMQQSSVHLHSKGGILAKACDYINELRSNSARLPDILKENERLAVDVELLRQQCDQLKATNQLLKAHLQQHGIQVTEVVEHAS